jgi:cytochrome c oxidase subunit 2
MTIRFCALAAFALAAVVALLGVFDPVMAAMGHSEPGQMVMQDAASPIAEEIHSFYDFVNIIIIAIAIFVALLMVYVMYRFRESANPTPSVTTHNTLLEVAWTVLPIFVLVAIAIPSFKLLHNQYTFPKADLTIKATGNAWFWSHAYPDQGIEEFVSTMLDDATTAQLRSEGKDAPRLLAVDNEVVVPLNKVVHVLITSNDVIHNWTIPGFGSKVDAVPGRVTATWFKATREGVFYGQCSELCGLNHAFMPIAVRVVKDDVFARWVEAKKTGDDAKVKEVIGAAEQDLKARKMADAGAAR